MNTPLSQTPTASPAYRTPSPPPFSPVTPRELSPSRQAKGKVTRRKDLTRDQKLAIRVLRRVGFTYQRIVEEFKEWNLSQRQVQCACKGPLESQKSLSRRKPLLGGEAIQYILGFIRRDQITRRMKWKDVAAQMPFHCSEKMLRLVLLKLGYKKYITPMKTLVFVLKHIAIRAKFAREHLHLMRQNRNKILRINEEEVVFGKRLQNLYKHRHHCDT
jgi:hypothetical protein